MFKASASKRLIELLSQGRLRSVAKGEVVTASDDNKSIHLICEGYIKRYQITNSGCISVQSIYGPNDIFPLTRVFKILFDKTLYLGPETQYYEAMCKTSFYELDSTVLLEAIKHDPLLHKDLLNVAGERLRSNIQQLENMSLSVYYKRVAHQLWFYANKFSDKKGNTAKLKVPLTQQDLADVLSTTRETVSLCMSDLKKRGLIKSGKYIVINDMRGLQKEAYS